MVCFAESITKVEDNRESSSKELRVHEVDEKVAEPIASDPEQTEDVNTEFDQSDAPEQLKPEAEAQPENTE